MLPLAVAIDRLTGQIQHGCGSESCTTSTCFTYRSRTNKGTHPPRQYTASSAKTIAIALADHEDGIDSFLCPYFTHDHEWPSETSTHISDPRVDPKSLTQQLLVTPAMQNLYKALGSEPRYTTAESKLVRLVASITEELSQENFAKACLACIFTFDEIYMGSMTEHNWLRRRISRSIVTAIARRTMAESNIKSEDRTMARIVQGVREEWQAPDAPPSTSIPMWTVELVEIVLDHWSGDEFVLESSLAGQALAILGSFWPCLPLSGRIGGDENPPLHNVADFQFRFYRHMRTQQVCHSWLTHRPKPGTRHLFTYPFLFREVHLIEYFRTCCHLQMRQAVDDTEAARRSREDAEKILRKTGLNVDTYLDRRMKITLEEYLVLEIGRETLVEDAFNQLWQREVQELRRPLRIRLGADLGEVGHDLGGVQLEFFNLLCTEMCNGNRSIFQTLEKSQMSWFVPGSIEPLHRYELFGVLFGLAVHNGVTLPVSFPMAFYVRLMGLPVTPDYNKTQAHLWEGWPDFCLRFRDISLYKGNVEEDLALTFTVPLEANGLNLSVDLDSFEWHKIPLDPLGRWEALACVSHVQTGTRSDDDLDVETLKWPGWRFHGSPPSHLPPRAVTSENVSEYVDSYAAWLMDHSVRPQFLAFAAGFCKVVDIRAIRLLPPQDFRLLVEGHRDINVTALRRYATDEGWEDATHLDWFWSIVEGYSQGQLRSLLEFVTASKRMPANEAIRLRFCIAAVDDEECREKLPWSSTCFGVLHLPKYESREIMERKLGIALEHSLGFGQA